MHGTPLSLMKTINMDRLNNQQISESIESLSGWRGDSVAIEKDFEFGDFSEAFAFLTRVAMLSEKMNHHAEWSGVYNKVSIRLSTHDAGGVTNKDLKMAAAIEGFNHPWGR
jgi:4a-hydroxytetrahydrobiopterin dehydratase